MHHPKYALADYETSTTVPTLGMPTTFAGSTWTGFFGKYGPNRRPQHWCNDFPDGRRGKAHDDLVENEQTIVNQYAS